MLLCEECCFDVMTLSGIVYVMLLFFRLFSQLFTIVVCLYFMYVLICVMFMVLVPALMYVAQFV